MATVNLRNVDGELVRAIKSYAGKEGMTLKAVMLEGAKERIGYESTKALAVPSEAGQDAGEVLGRGALGGTDSLVSGIGRDGGEARYPGRAIPEILRSIPKVVVASDLPTRKFPIPPCPKCRRPLTDLGQFFECQNSKCRFKRVSAEEVEMQFENREG